MRVKFALLALIITGGFALAACGDKDADTAEEADLEVEGDDAEEEAEESEEGEE